MLQHCSMCYLRAAKFMAIFYFIDAIVTMMRDTWCGLVYDEAGIIEVLTPSTARSGVGRVW